MGKAVCSVAVSDEVLRGMREKTDLLEAANALLREGRRDLAVDKFRDAAATEERLADLLADEGSDVLRAQALLSAGSAWYMAGEARAAVSALQMCMELVPESTTARFAERTFKAAVVAACAATGMYSSNHDREREREREREGEEAFRDRDWNKYCEADRDYYDNRDSHNAFMKGWSCEQCQEEEQQREGAEREAYERQMHEQQMHERQMHERQMHEQQMHEQQMHEQQMQEQEAPDFETP